MPFRLLSSIIVDAVLMVSGHLPNTSHIHQNSLGNTSCSMTEIATMVPDI